MNYYPNLYQNYPQYAATMPMSVQQQAPAINGKVVDSVEVVKATEVPIGGYAVFPKADLNEIYIKSWNSNGTTSVITYTPVVAEPETPAPAFNDVIEKINSLEEKINTLTDKMTKEEPTRKEIKKNAY